MRFKAGDLVYAADLDVMLQVALLTGRYAARRAVVVDAPAFGIFGLVLQTQAAGYDYEIRPLGGDGDFVIGAQDPSVCRAIVTFVGPVAVDDRLRGKP